MRLKVLFFVLILFFSISFAKASVISEKIMSIDSPKDFVDQGLSQQYGRLFMKYKGGQPFATLQIINQGVVDEDSWNGMSDASFLEGLNNVSGINNAKCKSIDYKGFRVFQIEMTKNSSQHVYSEIILFSGQEISFVLRSPDRQAYETHKSLVTELREKFIDEDF